MTPPHLSPIPKPFALSRAHVDHGQGRSPKDGNKNKRAHRKHVFPQPTPARYYRRHSHGKARLSIVAPSLDTTSRLVQCRCLRIFRAHFSSPAALRAFKTRTSVARCPLGRIVGRLDQTDGVDHVASTCSSPAKPPRFFPPPQAYTCPSHDAHPCTARGPYLSSTPSPRPLSIALFLRKPASVNEARRQAELQFSLSLSLTCLAERPQTISSPAWSDSTGERTQPSGDLAAQTDSEESV